MYLFSTPCNGVYISNTLRKIIVFLCQMVSRKVDKLCNNTGSLYTGTSIFKKASEALDFQFCYIEVI